MKTIVVSYFKAPAHAQGDCALLGEESYEGIEEVPVPNAHVFGEKLFFVKKFAGYPGYRWRVQTAQTVSAPGSVPVRHHIVLKEMGVPAPEEWLPQTLAKRSTKPATLLKLGAFVEVDYGFHAAVIKASGDIRSNKRYVDMVQAGEMPKRRLAIVISAGAKWVQVVPVSSVDPGQANSCFELERQSLAAMAGYSKRCWAIGHMVQSVSINRILPPETYVGPSSLRVSRNTSYASRLTSADKGRLEAALLRGTGQGAYLLYKDQLEEQRCAVIKRNREISQLKRTSKALQSESLAHQQLIAALQAQLARAELVIRQLYGPQQPFVLDDALAELLGD